MSTRGEQIRSTDVPADLQLEKFLTFSIGDEHFAIPVLVVREVLARPEITPTPFSPSYLLGIMNLRGQVLSVFDLRVRLNKKVKSSAEMCVIICDLPPYRVGIAVDSVDSVIALPSQQLNRVPSRENPSSKDFIKAITQIEEKLVAIIDVRKAFPLESLSPN